MSLTVDRSTDPTDWTVSPVVSTEGGVPHLWLPDLDGNEHTVSALIIALTGLVADYGDAVLDDLDCDISGGYIAFRAPRG